VPLRATTCRNPLSDSVIVVVDYFSILGVLYSAVCRASRASVWGIVAMPNEHWGSGSGNVSNDKEIPMVCADVMTANPSCCELNDFTVRAARTLRDEDVDSVPIVNNPSENATWALFTDRDLRFK